MDGRREWDDTSTGIQTRAHDGRDRPRQAATRRRAPSPRPHGLLGSASGAVARVAVGCLDDGRAVRRHVSIPFIREGEDVFEYVYRSRGQHDQAFYEAIIEAAGESRGSEDGATRTNARSLLANTAIGDLRAHPLHEDAVVGGIEVVVDGDAYAAVEAWTMGNLRDYLIAEDVDAIMPIMSGLPSELIGLAATLMTHDERIAVSRKLSV